MRVRRGTSRICALLISLSAAFAVAPHLHAQQRESALSDAEVEKLRDTAAFPSERLAAFTVFLDDRAKAIQTLSTGPRKPGREEDLHDLMTQFTSVADDLEDNLDDYGERRTELRPDLRKALPKLISAVERWGTTLKTPPDDDTYNIARKLALEALKDIHDQATQLLEEQRAWFAAHPPGKEPKKATKPETDR